ncbi:MAG: hypothetical protein FWF82_06160, partial [Oscillospiraceae bacterium]|nr:hypothetical protein [Oscillospiraceae bacterium]
KTQKRAFLSTGWDEEEGLILYSVGISGGFDYFTYGITDVIEDGNDYSVDTIRLVMEYDNEDWQWLFKEYKAEFYRYTFHRNDNGVLNLMSIKKTGGEEPDWFKSTKLFYEINRESREFDELIFTDFDGDGVKDVIILPYMKVVSMKKKTVEDLNPDDFDPSEYESHYVDRGYYGSTPEQNVAELFRDFY